ncbi:hypothetical protein HXX76_013521 [Chlamydomonas incerta]|uniref:protein-S-isoprenylcysteine alpha-carbonyl methylesterase n=1 Tax=Chlamydomonas incerta TaxID=51695 RepID=A0A835SEU2_CHLIN|nr:hypothetical protein HXX76_013521 [Chlamydomonas incerta]|eukprot:KAG2425679.1 hypothetical protein HXX76_013521 [Chlamydomonas incerta]
MTDDHGVGSSAVGPRWVSPATDDLTVPIITESEPASGPRPQEHAASRRCWNPFRAVWKALSAVVHVVVLVFKIIYIVLALAVYAMLLMPGFLRMIYYYFFNKCVVRGLVYGDKPRNRLDLYYPPSSRAAPATTEGATYPLVIYVTGGAWTIGYKAWGALLARRLSEQGVLVACLDYRNFPQGDALDMLEDVNTGICWVLRRAHRLGGDPDNVTLVGQSAGGHLAGLSLLRQAEQAASGRPALGATPSWSPGSLKAFVGVSGAFDLVDLAAHRGGTFRGLLDRILAVDASSSGATGGGGGAARGVVQGIVATAGVSASEAAAAATLPVADRDAPPGGPSGPPPALPDVEQGGGGADHKHGETPLLQSPVSSPPSSGAGGEAPPGGAADAAVRGKRRGGGARVPAYDALSPLEAARHMAPDAAALLPDVLLVHGTTDKTVPCEGSARLAQALQAAGAARPVRCVLVPGKTHTAFLLEDPMRGGRDLLMDCVLGAVLGGGEDDPSVGGRVNSSLCPGFLCTLAGWVCPF